MAFVRKHPLAAYFFLAYAITWALVSPLVASAHGLIALHIPPLWHALGALGPLLAALIVTAVTGGKLGLREYLGRITRWRVPPVWWCAALSPLLLFAASALILSVTGRPWPDFGMVGRDWPITASWLAGIFYGFGEEPGWRGFALPHLQRRHNALSATAILTLFWAAWHAPFFFYRFPFGPGALIGFLTGLFAGAIWLTCLYNGSGGSALLAVVFHASLNAVYQPMVASSAMLTTMSILIMVGAAMIVIVWRAATLAPRRKPLERDETSGSRWLARLKSSHRPNV